MNKRRLLKLADLLEADAKNKKGIKFDLSVVAKPALADREVSCLSPHFKKGQSPTWDCGTAACAVGLAVVSGAFKREGFDWYISRGNGVHPKYKGSYGFGRAEKKFFDLTDRESSFLFMPGYYPETPKGAAGERLVAKRIRQFVAGKVSPDSH